MVDVSQPVHAFHQRGFATTGRTKYYRNFLFRNSNIDILQDMLFTDIQVEIFD
jgi:hypothetical protein